GQVHEVHTGVMLRTDQEERVFTEKTAVEFWPLTDREIERYIATQDPFDKAGAYGIQGPGAVLVKQIRGDYYNVVGLPISRVVRELRPFMEDWGWEQSSRHSGYNSINCGNNCPFLSQLFAIFVNFC